MMLVPRRNSRAFLVSLLLAAAWLGDAGAAYAEDRPATTALAAADKAFQEVDFTVMREQAGRAIEVGGATRDETARAYVLLGIASAALGRDEAKQAFIVALALDPTLKLERTLSPKLREPYLEAQGYWGAYPERLGLRARPAEDGEHVSVELTDPAHLGKSVGFFVRVTGTSAFEKRTAVAARSTRFALPSDPEHRGYEYFATVVDEHQNVLTELGSESDPQVIRAPAREPVRESATVETKVAPRRSYLVPILLGGAGLAAVGVGVVFHLERESAAREWNGPGCERPGASRIDQCGGVDSRRRLDEILAIGGYTTGGLLLAGAAVALVIGRPPPLEQGPEPARAGLVGCGVAGAVVSCAGRF